MYLGYNTNGLAHHDPLEAITLLSEIGYRGVALTIDHGMLNPYAAGLDRRIAQINSTLENFALRSVIETGARFLLDYRQKHEPTLMSPEPQRRAERVEFLQHAIAIAAKLRSDCVSFWSGVLRDQLPDETALERLTSALQPVIDCAEEHDVVLAFEPEPGMFIDTMASYQRLVELCDAPCFQLTLDVGHLHCLAETPIPDVIRHWSPRLANIHIEDMREGVHEHLMFGDGDMQFAPIIESLHDVHYEGGVHVELSRHSHEGPTAALRAFHFLQPLMEGRA